MLKDSQQTQSKATLITRRMFMLAGLKLAVFLGIVSRLFYLQISENIKYRSLSDKNRLREWKVPPQRGIIEDFFGEKIANNTQVFQLHMMPEDVPNFEVLFFRLTKLINFTLSLVIRFISETAKAPDPIPGSQILTFKSRSSKNLELCSNSGIFEI